MSEAAPPIFRAPMRSRIVEARPGAGADHAIERGEVGIGDAVNGRPASVAEAVLAVARTHGEKAGRMLARFAGLPDGTFVWTRQQDGTFRLGRISGAWRYDDSPAAREVGIHHVRPAVWSPRGFGDHDVPAAVAHAFARGGRNLQRTHDRDAERQSVEYWEGHPLRVRHVQAGEQSRLRELRLAALDADPRAFGSTRARDAARAPEWWTRWAAASGDGIAERTFLLVDDENRWLGLVLVRLQHDRSAVATLYGMWVSPLARGRGSAARLCEACAEWASGRGARELRLSVLVGNDAAIRAYEAAGFIVCGRTTSVHDGRVMDELLMARDLRSA